MSTLTGAWRALRTALLADATLKATLGAADAIYRRMPRDKVPLPCIALHLRAVRPLQETTFVGIYLVDLQFHLFSTNPDTLDTLHDLLEDRFSIPVTKTSPIDAGTHWINGLRFLNAIEVGPVRLTNSNQDVEQMTVEAVARVSRKTA